MNLHRNGLEFLRDGRGIYGLDFRMKTAQGPTTLVIRPDKLGDRGAVGAAVPVLQAVPLRPKIFRNSVERGLADGLHQILFRDSCHFDGLDPQCGQDGLRRDAALRRKFFGNQAKAFRITNALIGRLLAEAGDKDAITAARRFRARERFPVYAMATRSQGLLQICDTFPLLATLIADNLFYEEADARARDHALDIAKVIEKGRTLNHVARVAELPLVMRAVPPQATVPAYNAKKWFETNPHLINHMPRSSRAARSWFDMLVAAANVSHDFAIWCAKRVPFDRLHEETVHEIRNIGDWVRAGYEAQADAVMQEVIEKYRDRVPASYFMHPMRSSRVGSGLIKRPFSSDMSLTTVRSLNEEWHDAVASRQFSANVTPLPEPWSEPAEMRGYQFIPLTTAMDMYQEGKAMKSCVATYAERVRRGACYIYSMSQGDKHIATVEVQPNGDTGVQLGQMAGPCNQRLDRKTERVIHKWFKATTFNRPLKQSRDPAFAEMFPGNPNRAFDLDAEIPF